MNRLRPVELLEQAVCLLEQLADQGRAWSVDDLLTAEEVRRRLRVGKDNRKAMALLARTELKHAPGDARWRWGDVLDATREAVADPTVRPPIPMAMDIFQPRKAPSKRGVERA